MIVTSRAPVRIDFAGGWTDVDAFVRGAGGAVLNATINHYVTGRLETDENGEEQSHGAREGMSVAYGCDLPTGSGLGTSSALNVVWLSLIKSRVISREERQSIAEAAYDLETLLGILGGKQDQYAAAFGGFNFITFGDTVGVETLAVPLETVRALEDRLVLCYTGRPRLSGSIHENVWSAFRRGVPETVNALYALREVAILMRTVLIEGRLEEFGTLLSRNWTHQKALDPSVTNAQIEELFATASGAGAVGGKACGAGGGGCLLFFAPTERRQAVAGALASAGARVIPFQFEFEGLTVQTQ